MWKMREICRKRAVAANRTPLFALSLYYAYKRLFYFIF